MFGKRLVALLEHAQRHRFTDIDERGARMQLCELPVVARVTAHKVEVGERLVVRLTAADPAQGTAQFERVA